MRLFKVFFKHCVIGFFMLLCCRSDWWLLCGWWMQRWLQRPGMRRVCGRRGSTRSFVARLRRCPADTWYAKGHDLAVAPRHRLQRMGAQMPPRLDSSFCTSDPKLSFKQNRKPFKNLTALHFFLHRFSSLNPYAKLWKRPNCRTEWPPQCRMNKMIYQSLAFELQFLCSVLKPSDLFKYHQKDQNWNQRILSFWETIFT